MIQRQRLQRLLTKNKLEIGLNFFVKEFNIENIWLEKIVHNIQVTLKLGQSSLSLFGKLKFIFSDKKIITVPYSICSLYFFLCCPAQWRSTEPRK